MLTIIFFLTTAPCYMLGRYKTTFYDIRSGYRDRALRFRAQTNSPPLPPPTSLPLIRGGGRGAHPTKNPVPNYALHSKYVRTLTRTRENIQKILLKFMLLVVLRDITTEIRSQHLSMYQISRVYKLLEYPLLDSLCRQKNEKNEIESKARH